jgi:hypothetical protein
MEWLMLGQVDLAHGPAAKAALGDFFVVQQHHVLVARVLLDVAIQLAHRHAPALDGLQEDAAAIAQDAGDAAGGVVLARLGQDGFDGLGLVSTARLA